MLAPRAFASPVPRLVRLLQRGSFISRQLRLGPSRVSVAVRGRRWGAASERGVVAGVAFRQREALKRNTRGPAPAERRSGVSPPRPPRRRFGFLVRREEGFCSPTRGRHQGQGERLSSRNPRRPRTPPGRPGFWRCRLLPPGPGTTTLPLCWPRVRRGERAVFLASIIRPSRGLRSPLSSVSGT